MPKFQPSPISVRYCIWFPPSTQNFETLILHTERRKWLIYHNYLINNKIPARIWANQFVSCCNKEIRSICCSQPKNLLKYPHPNLHRTFSYTDPASLGAFEFPDLEIPLSQESNHFPKFLSAILNTEILYFNWVISKTSKTIITQIQERHFLTQQWQGSLFPHERLRQKENIRIILWIYSVHCKYHLMKILLPQHFCKNLQRVLSHSRSHEIVNSPPKISVDWEYAGETNLMLNICTINKADMKGDDVEIISDAADIKFALEWRIVSARNLIFSSVSRDSPRQVWKWVTALEIRRNEVRRRGTQTGGLTRGATFAAAPALFPFSRGDLFIT